MTRRASPRVGAYAGLTALGLLASLALGRPELVAIVVPFAFVLAIGLTATSAPHLTIHSSLDRERVVEGETLTVYVDVSTDAAVERLELFLPLPEGLDADPELNPVAAKLQAGERRRFEISVHCARWGGYAPGEVVVRAHDLLALFVFETTAGERTPLRVYPAAEDLLTILRPLETQVFAGNQVARAKGDGIEFADIRPFAPGDRVRRVNWRASARRGELVVNELHPERNTDVILFLDTFSEARRADLGTLDLAVRATAALASEYLQQKDRVGLVGLGGMLNWLQPATGLVQLYRIADALLDTEVILNYAWRDIDVIPSRTLPPHALVLAITPLLDERAGEALLDLRARRFDVAIIEVSPVPFVPPGSAPRDDLAHRLWRHRRAALRHRFERVGVPVVEWREDVPLARPLEEVTAYRRHARISRV